MSRTSLPGGRASRPSDRLAGWPWLTALLLWALGGGDVAGQDAPAADDGAPAPPVLDFPEPGLDDPAAYEGYRTRFFRDVAGNTVQVYLNGEDGRAVLLWADAANESAGFTVRGDTDEPVALAWAGDGARIGGAREAGGERWLELDLVAGSAGTVRVGLFALGTMRFERDIQYGGLHRGPLDARLRLDELVAAADALERLDPAERARHLEALGAPDAPALRARLDPALDLGGEGGRWRLRVVQPSFDGVGSLRLEISGDRATSDAGLDGRVLTIRPRGGAPAAVRVRLATDAAPLTPLTREEIFTPALLSFAAGSGAEAEAEPGDLRRRRLERQLRSAELLSSREKLMAGLPNFATYFGRDMLMTALMMRDVWTPAMTEHVITIALRKLGPDGGVSHEEALGGQAVREAAADYARRVEEALSLDADHPGRARALDHARALLASMAATRENHRMMDDDFQLPLVVAGWLADDRVDAAARRRFLLEAPGPGFPDRLSLLVSNLGLVAERTAAYAADPRPRNLVAFSRMENGRFHPGSWRDSGAGYGNGTYALDVNAIWAPAALAAAADLLAGIRALGLGDALEAALAGGSPALRRLAAEPGRLDAAVRAWRGAVRHFMVNLDGPRVERAIEAWLAARPADEASLWRRRLRQPATGLRFPALALDSTGAPISVLSTDPAMALFLGGPETGEGGWAYEALDPVLRPYPAGLLLSGVGPVVANDVYAPASVRAAFEADAYHSPRVVWGREANLLLLALAHRIGDARADAESADEAGDGEAAAAARSREGFLRTALDSIRGAVEASGLKHHELWSYRPDGEGVEPVRYGTSTDVQLWNVTDLAVQYALTRLPPR